MDDGKTPASPMTSSKADPRPAPTDAELSRMAREAVHQAPDPHLDRHLQRMGLVDAPDAPAQPNAPDARVGRERDVGQAAIPEVGETVTLELLDRRLRRTEVGIRILGIALVVLAVVEVVQLIR
jgi:hypothetical protein